MKRTIRVILSLLALSTIGAGASASEIGSPWHAAYNSKARLVAGLATSASGGALQVYAGVEIAMEPGWKTYWRMPGDSGGLAPTFDFAASRNLMSAEVLYPAPQRMPDPAGTSVGYKGSVIFPVRIVPRDPAEPVQLAVQLEYGICREICVPAEAALALSIPGGLSAPAPDALQRSLRRVPSKPGLTRTRDPVLHAARFDPAQSKFYFKVRVPGGANGADLFVEAPEGIYLPLPAPSGGDGKEQVTFELDLSDGIDPAELSGKVLRLTMTGGGGQSEANWTAPAVPPR